MRQRALAFMLAMLVAVTGTACAGTDKTQEEEKTLRQIQKRFLRRAKKKMK